MIKTPIEQDFTHDGWPRGYRDADKNRVSVTDLVEAFNSQSAELTALREFVASLNSLAFEEWFGNYKINRNGKFTIFDSDGKCVVSGDNALTAWEEFGKNES